MKNDLPPAWLFVTINCESTWPGLKVDAGSYYYLLKDRVTPKGSACTRVLP